MKTCWTRYAIAALAIWSVVLGACGKSGDSEPKPNQGGSLYYSEADALIRFDFDTGKENVLFSGGDNYRVWPKGQVFVWYKTDFSAGTTTCQIHQLVSPDQYRSISLPYILEATPRFAPEGGLLGVLARSPDRPDTRTDLLLLESDGTFIGRIPHVKDFAFSPNGKDLVVSAEALDADGNTTGYALGLVKNFSSATSQQSITIKVFSAYDQLPVDLSFSSDGGRLAMIQADHIFTLSPKENASVTQVTTSRFREVDVNWSPDGRYLVFAGNTPGVLDCGEIRIVSAQPEKPIEVPEDGYDNTPVDPLQPVDNNGKVIHSCGSASIVWIP